MKEEIVLKHLAKYYNRKGRIINNDDILPMSRILPMMDEYAQEYHKAQSPTQSQQAGDGWSEERVLDLIGYIKDYGRAQELLDNYKKNKSQIVNHWDRERQIEEYTAFHNYCAHRTLKPKQSDYDAGREYAETLATIRKKYKS